MSEFEIANPNLPVTVQLEMHGPIFEPGLPIPLVIKSLESVQSIVDKSYLVLAGKNRLSSQDRATFFLRSQGIQHSSLTTDLEFLLSIAQPVLPFISNLGPIGIWEYAKSAWEFLKFVLEQRKIGSGVSIGSIGDNNTFTVVAGNQSHTYMAPVYNIALNSLSHYEALSKLLSPTKVNDIRLGTGKRRDIAMSLQDADLFDIPSTIDEEVLVLYGEIFEFDKFDGEGKLNIFTGQLVPKGEYKFVVIGRQSPFDYIESMKHSQVSVRCHLETADHPLLGARIVNLQVLSVNA